MGSNPIPSAIRQAHGKPGEECSVFMLGTFLLDEKVDSVIRFDHKCLSQSAAADEKDTQGVAKRLSPPAVHGGQAALSAR